jgi:hypothetical protein
MRTELLHSYSSTSLSNLSRSPSFLSINSKGSSNNDNFNSPKGIGGDKYATLGEDYLPKEDAVQDGCCAEFVRKTFTRKNIAKKLPIISWLPKYNTSKAVSDFIAGLTVGLTLIPQGLAMASVAGLPMQVCLNEIWSLFFISFIQKLHATSCS